jgi:hypothetical protein
MQIAHRHTGGAGAAFCHGGMTPEPALDFGCIFCVVVFQNGFSHVKDSFWDFGFEPFFVFHSFTPTVIPNRGRPLGTAHKKILFFCQSIKSN